MFLDGSFLHVFGNMLFLAIFGPTIEDSMGRVRFLVFYLLAGLTELGAQVLVDSNSTTSTLGASGAIAAVLGGYIVLYPRARILSLVLVIFFVTIVEVPAVLLLGFWFVVQLYFGAAGLASSVASGEGVAHFAHVGGFVFGLLLIRLFVRGPRRKPTLDPTLVTARTGIRAHQRSAYHGAARVLGHRRPLSRYVSPLTASNQPGRMNEALGERDLSGVRRQAPPGPLEGMRASQTLLTSIRQWPRPRTS
jgi:membrane associated rhomboid family serine protease